MYSFLRTFIDELKIYKARLKSLSEEVRVLAKRSLGEPLNKSTRTLVETVQKTVQGIDQICIRTACVLQAALDYAIVVLTYSVCVC